MIKRFLHIVIWGLLIAGLVFAIVFVEQKHSETICEQFDLNVENQDYDALTSAEALKDQIIEGTDTLSGKTLAEINPYEIHLILDRNPYVKYADIQTGIDGKMKIDVVLREAMIRVVNKNNLSYYIDREGWIMPISPGFPSRVLVANGSINDGISKLGEQKIHIDSLSASSAAVKLFGLASYITKDEFLHKLIGQIWINRSGELELTPVIGEYTIMFGGFEDMEDKFEKLSAYYMEGAGKAGWIDYKSIDLRYKNQVICSK